MPARFERSLPLSSVNVTLSEYRVSETLAGFLHTLAELRGTSANEQLERILRAAYAAEMPGMRLMTELPRGAERQTLIALLRLPTAHGAFDEGKAWLSVRDLVKLLGVAPNTVSLVVTRLLERQALHRVQRRDPEVSSRGPAPYAYSLTGYGLQLVHDCIMESTDFEANPLPYQTATLAIMAWEKFLTKQGLPLWDSDAEQYEPAPTPPAFIPRLANGRRLDQATCKAHECERIASVEGYCDVHA